jgi:hypothetical protein
MMSLAGGVLGAAASFYSAYTQKSTDTKARRQQRAQFGQMMAAYQESQAKIWSAYNEQVEYQKAERDEYLEAQTERWAPYIESQKQALAAYQKAAYEPETSAYAKLRMEESEKAINKELAKRGILFSGAASELREKSRQNIMAEESEKAKAMLEKLATGISPVEPGYLTPASVSIPGGAGLPGASSVSGTTGWTAGITGGVNALMSGVQGYQQALGYESSLGINNPWWKVGMGGTSTTGLYGGYEY